MAVFAVAEGVAPVARAFTIGGLQGGHWPTIINSGGSPIGPPFSWGKQERKRWLHG